MYKRLSNGTASRVGYRLSSWLLYDPRNTNSTHPLMKFLPTMQNSWFCSKNPRRNSFIKYLHLVVKNILFQPKLLLLSFSPYFITHFALLSTTVPSQLVEAEFWVSHFFTVSNTIPRATSPSLTAQRSLQVNIVAVITTVAILIVYVALWPMKGVIDEIRVCLIIYYLSTLPLIHGLSS